jgi:hypothetical protein
MFDKVCQFLDPLRGRGICGVCSYASEDLDGFMFRPQPEEVVELAKVGQFTLHLLVLPLHGLGRLLVGAQLVDTAGVFLATAGADGALAIALGLPLSTGHTGTQRDRPLWFLGQQRAALGRSGRVVVHGGGLEGAKRRHGWIRADQIRAMQDGLDPYFSKNRHEEALRDGGTRLGLIRVRAELSVSGHDLTRVRRGRGTGERRRVKAWRREAGHSAAL